MLTDTLRQGEHLAVRLFSASLIALVLSFALLAEEHQRNWLLYLTALMGLGFLAQRRTRTQILRNPASLALAALLALPLLSLLWSEPGAGNQRVERKDLLIAALCISGIYVGLTATNSSTARFSGRLQLAFAAAALLGLWLALGHWWFWLRPDAERPRFEGGFAFYNAVHAAIFTLAAGLLAIYNRLTSPQPAPAWLSSLLLLSVLLFSLLAGARAATAAFVAVTLAMVLRQGVGLRVGLAGCAALALGLGASLLLVGPEQLQNIWFSRGLSFRLEIWDQVLTQYRACQPLLGCGIAAPPAIVAGLETGHRAHSMLLAALYYQGVVGMVVFVGGLGYLLYRGARFGAAAWGWVLAYALLANLTSGDHLLERATLFWPYFWLPVLMLASVSPAHSAVPAQDAP